MGTLTAFGEIGQIVADWLDLWDIPYEQTPKKKRTKVDHKYKDEFFNAFHYANKGLTVENTQ